jgi:hypothetical protein
MELINENVSLIKYTIGPWERTVNSNTRDELATAAENLNEFDLSLRKELIIATLNRADHSGEVLRTLLFAASGVALGLLLYPQQQTADVKLGYHAMSAVSFIICAAAVLVSWHFQKRKAIKRYNAVLKRGVVGLLRREKEFKEHWWLNNTLWDLTAAGALGLGVAVEGLLRII